MKPYPKYKDSGIEWLGEVPDHWEILPIKHLAIFINGDAFKPSEWTTCGTPIIRIQNLNGGEEFNYFNGDIEERYLVTEGDLLFGWSGNRGTSFGPFLWQKQGVYALNQHIFRVIPKVSDKRLLYWALKAATTHIEEQAHGIIGMVHITKGDLGAINVPAPPIPEQTIIAAFLDRKTAEIDSIIAKKERLIELYEEEKAAVINHAVTKGLDPAAKMKDSGIEWIGDVPEHWKISKLKYIIKNFESGVSVNATDFPASEEETGILKTSCVYDCKFNPEENKAIWPEELIRAKVNPRKGEIIISRMNTPELVGASGYVTKDYNNLFLPDRLWQTVFYDSVEINSYLLSFTFNSSNFRNILSAIATGSSPSMKNLSQESFLDISIPITEDKEEQTTIATFLDRKTAEIDSLIANKERQIELLKEYRTALISEAVTGKIDLRHEI